MALQVPSTTLTLPLPPSDGDSYHSVTLRGRSRAGDGTTFVLEELKWMFDMGALVQQGIPDVVCLTHTHNDHITFMAQILTSKQKHTHVYLPKKALPLVQSYLQAHQTLIECGGGTGDDDGEHDQADTAGKDDPSKHYTLHPVEFGQDFPLRIKGTSYTVKAIECDHRVDCLGFSIFQKIRTLKPEYAELTGAEIGRLNRDGVSTYDYHEEPFLCYLGDTTHLVFERHPEILKQQHYIVVECSFFCEKTRDQAKKTKHMHWDDLKPIVEANPRILFVLIHFSLRYSPVEIRNFFVKQSAVTQNVHPMLVPDELRPRFGRNRQGGQVHECICFLCQQQVRQKQPAKRSARDGDGEGDGDDDEGYESRRPNRETRPLPGRNGRGDRHRDRQRGNQKKQGQKSKWNEQYQLPTEEATKIELSTVPLTATVPEDRERLLDQFPLTATELDQLMSLSSKFDTTNPSKSLLISLDARLGEKKSCHHILDKHIGRLFEVIRTNVFLLAFAESEALYTTATFLEACVILLGRRGEAAVERAIWEGGKIGSDQNAPTGAALMNFVQALVVAIEEFSHRSTESVAQVGKDAPAAWIDSVVSSGDAGISAPNFRQWVAEVAPNLPFLLSTFFHYLMFGTVERAGCPWSLPVPPKSDNTSRLPGTPPLASFSVLTEVSTAVPLISMGLCGHLWKSLYQSTEQGLSFHTLESRLTSFFGPTVLLIRSSKGDIFGYYTEIPWKITSRTTSSASLQEMSEGKDAFLFTLNPVWRRFGRTHEEPKGRIIQYLYGASQKTSVQTGLSIGGVSTDAPRVHLDTTLERCKAASIGRVFQDGPLLASSDDLYFDVDEIQLYAVAPDIETLLVGQQLGQRAMETREALRQKLAHVDKKQFVDDLVFLPGHLFEHREQSRGRADFVAHDEGEGYYIGNNPPSPHVCIKPSNHKTC